MITRFEDECELWESVAQFYREEAKESSLHGLMDALEQEEWSSKSLTAILNGLREKCPGRPEDVSCLILYLFMRLVEEGRIKLSLEVMSTTTDKDSDDLIDTQLKGKSLGGEEIVTRYGFGSGKGLSKFKKRGISSFCLTAESEGYS